MARPQVKVVDTTNYPSFDELFSLIEEPLQASLREQHAVWFPLFKASQGAGHNHHSWHPFGYLDHIQECMVLAVSLYQHLSLTRPLDFTLSSALAVLYLHDIEKPFRYVRGEPNLETKDQRKKFRREFVHKWGIPLSPAEIRALDLVEGENDEYSPNERIMTPLVAFCHACDTMSARIWFDFGISRVKTK